MASDLDYQDIVDDEDGEGAGSWTAPPARNRNGRYSRRAIEALREERRLKALLSDYDIEDLDEA